MQMSAKDLHRRCFVGYLKAIMLLVALPVSAFSTLQAQPFSNYHIYAEVLPGKQLSVEVDIDFVPELPTNRLQFLLHADLGITSLASEQIDSYDIQQEYNPYGLDTAYVQLITIQLSRQHAVGEPVSLSWQYRGQFNNNHFQLGPSAFYEDWTELEVGSLWLPTLSNLQHQFHVEVSVKVPDHYTVAGPGHVKHKGRRWQLQSTVPAIDFPLIISDEMQVDRQNSEQLAVSLYHTGISDKLASFVSQNTFEVMRFYKQLFGDGHQKTTLRLVVPPSTRARDQAYARPQLIVLSQNSKSNANTFDFIAHEAGHLWWLNAQNTQSMHNFMNEAFAEYSSYLAVREIRGEEAFREKVDTARKEARQLPGFDEWTPRNNRQLSYYKGSYLLYQLHNRIGDDQFYTFLRSLLHNKTGTIEGMLELLSEEVNGKTAEWFKSKLYK